MSTENRVALVTGAARGLARGIAQNLAEAGYRVAFTYRPDGTRPEQTLAALATAGREGFPIPADHAVRGATQAAVDAAEARFGRLDAFVHAAGPIVVRRFAASTYADYETMLAANLGSAVEGAFAALPGMRSRGFGRLVFFGMNGSHDTRSPARLRSKKRATASRSTRSSRAIFEIRTSTALRRAAFRRRTRPGTPAPGKMSRRRCVSFSRTKRASSTARRSA